MPKVEQRCVELTAQIQDKTLSIAERQAAAAELADAVKSVSRTDATTAATAVSKLVDLERYVYSLNTIYTYTESRVSSSRSNRRYCIQIRK